MRAAYVARPDRDDPLAALEIGHLEPPTAPEGWVEVEVRATSLNMHDVWLLRGAGVRPKALPLVLGSDAAGVVDGREVVVHPVAPDPPGTFAPGATLLCDAGFGTLAGRTCVPEGNLVDKPAGLTWEQAACLPTAWLTAWRMLVTQARVEPGQVVLVQGAGGGVATAAATLATGLGCRVHVTSRSEEKRARAVEFGAAGAWPPGARLPELADVVIESVGAATWEHSLRAVRPAGTVVVCGGASGMVVETDLARVFARQLRIIGSSMGSIEEMRALVDFVESSGVGPVVDSTSDLDGVAAAYDRMLRGDAYGKLCVVPS
ncbi:zinc-binding dehydrogenase [Nocardioides sp. SYSU D00038]|uniref:zinc-binding dehydrogenase n=1 Tax=Nocardioides sp. SYSU D00038 TaxID=2812554 RepID=UPI00196788A9|nr:zinc-binding dehydrogenase [Nocardioides sp. SYSU D00038]